jgi:hypothetical protein
MTTIEEEKDMYNNGDTPTQDSFIAEARALANKAQTRLAVLEAQRKALDGEIAWLRKYVRTVDPPTTMDAPRTRKKNNWQTKWSPQKLVLFAEACLEFQALGHERFDAYDISEHMGYKAPDGTRKAFNQLREMEFLARAGEKQQVSGRGLPRQQFTVDRAEQLELLKEQAANAPT